MADAHCDSCKFFDKHHGASAHADAGLCRYNPPVNQPAPEAKGLWPVVDAEDWCGHFTAEMTAAE